MRHLAGVAFGFILLILPAMPASGREGQAAPLSPKEAAERVAAAFAAGDAEALKALAAMDTPDPWVVADRLCGQGGLAAALAFARAAPRPDVATLPAYLESRKERADELPVREAINRAASAIHRRDPGEALELLESAASGRGDVLSVLVENWRGLALEGLERHQEAARSLEAAGRAAAALGWLRRAISCLNRAGRSFYFGGDMRGALRCLELQVRIAEKRGDLSGQAEALHGQAFTRARLGEHGIAVKLFRRAADLFRKAGRLERAADSLMMLALRHAKHGEQDEAITVYEEARRIFEETGNLSGVAGCWIDIGSRHQAAVRFEQALASYERGIALAREAGALRYLCVGLENAGNVLIELQRHAEAKAKLDEMLETARSLESDLFQATALQLLGSSCVEQGRHDEASSLLRAALPLCRKAGDRVREALILQQLGFLHHELGENRKAIGFHGRELEIQTARGDDAGIAAALNNLGLVHSRIGENRKARVLFERGLAAAERAGHTRWTANLLSNLGDCWRRLLDLDRALEMNQRAYRLSLSARDWEAASSALGDVARIEGDRGNRLREFELRHEALDLAWRSKSRRMTAVALEWLADSLSGFGEHRRALDLYRRARELFQELAAKRDLAISHYFVGVQLDYLGEHEAALESLERGRAAAEEIGARKWEASCLCGRARLLLEMDRHEEALEAAEAAKLIACDAEDPFCEARALEHVGDANRHLDRPAREGECYRRALAIYRRSGAGFWVAGCLRRLAQLALDGGRPEEAAELAAEAVAELRLHSRGLGEERAAAVREHESEVYAVGARAGIEMGDLSLVARFVEEGRAAVLLEALKGRDSLRHALIPKKLREQERLARVEEREAACAAREAEKSGRLDDARSARERLETAREQLFETLDRIRRTAKAQAPGVCPGVDSLAEIQARLREGEALVFYVRLLSECAALIVTPEESRVVELGPYETIRDAADLEFDDPSKELDEPVARLRGLLMEPLELEPTVERLLVSPDPELAFVPLSLLAPGREVAFVPSGTTYGVLVAEREARGSSVLARGDPDYGVERDPAATSAIRSGWRLAPLPRSREEAKAIGDVLLLGRKATESGLLDAVAARPRWRAIHLACHGCQHADRPSLSALALTPEKERDGYLTCAEILISRFSADLVTLSACDTARGEAFCAEGVIGLTRAFLSVGAPRVLSSLWKVDDEATKALMVKFYELWNPKEGNGLPAATALKQAQEFVRSHEKWKHPHYWAAWVLWGLPD